MKISLITVCFNSDKTIRETFESVKNQSYKDIEYIVIDGGSTDNTLKIANDYSDIITKLISEPDKGLYDAMNKGVVNSTGEIVGLINSDDIFCDNNAISNVMSIFKRNLNLDSVYADLFYVSQFNTNKIVRKWITGIKKSFSSGWHPAHPTFYVKKHIYNSYGLYDLDYTLAADFELMLRFIEKFNISVKYLEMPIIKMRLGGESNKSLKNICIQNFECLRAFKKNKLKNNILLYPLKRIIPKILQFKK